MRNKSQLPTIAISNAGLTTETNGFVSIPRAICIFIDRIYKIKNGSLKSVLN